MWPREHGSSVAAIWGRPCNQVNIYSTRLSSFSSHCFPLAYCRDSSGRSPYCLAREKAVRDVFRRFMAQFPTTYDYTAAQVPSPLTEEKERERREKAAEKKRERRKAKKQREKVISV